MAVTATTDDPQAPANGEAEGKSSQPTDSGLICLVMMLRFFGLPAEPGQLHHQFGRADQPFSAPEILRAAKRLGLKARLIRSKASRLADMQLPAIALAKDGSFFLLAAANDEVRLVQYPGDPAPKRLNPHEFEDIWSGRLILLAKRARDPADMGRFGIRWFIPALIKYRKLFTEVLIASLFIQLFALISPLFFQVVIDKVLVHRGLTTLDVLIIGLAGIAIFEGLLGGLRQFIFAHTTNRVDVELGARLYAHMLALPMAYFQSRRVGESVARVRELETIRNFLTGSALTLVLDLAFTGVFFFVMYLFSPLLTAVVAASIPFYIVLAVVVTPVLRNRLQEKFARSAENQAFLVESVTGIETVKAMAVEPQMRRNWEEQLAAYVGASFRAANLGNIASQCAQVISKLTIALTLWLGAKLAIEGDITVGQLVAFNMLSGRVIQPVLRLAQIWQEFQQMRISMLRLGDILNTSAEPSYSPGRTSLPQLQGETTLDHVTFRYRADGPEILSDFSLTVPAGQMVGVVGPSGSGKSTLTKLIQRLYVPERGRVLIDGTDLALVDPAWLRRQVGVVLQENILFNRSVRDNIALTDPGCDMERVIHAAKLAGAHDFILELPEGYDTVVGERGGTLSGGQRQRIAIARALLTNPGILIFDEATSALDYESEAVIQNNMREIAAGRTVFIIAHRLSAVRDCHRIITIEKGRLVEDGNHDELIGANGRYAAMWRAQAEKSLDG